MGGFDHVEVWVADFEVERRSWAWLLDRLRFSVENRWSGGESWGFGGVYLTITTPPTLTTNTSHDRRLPGVNHLAFKAGTRSEVDALMVDAGTGGWRTLYQDRYPYAGGPNHYAGWLENSAGFKVELVAERP